MKSQKAKAKSQKLVRGSTGTGKKIIFQWRGNGKSNGFVQDNGS